MDTFHEIIPLIGLLLTLRDVVPFAFCSVAFLYCGKNTRAKTLKIWAVPSQTHMLLSYTFIFKECILEEWGTNHGEPQRFASVKIQPLTSLAPATVRGIY
jgi:hypothetical protein